MQMLRALKDHDPIFYSLRERFYDFRHRLRRIQCIDPEGSLYYIWLGLSSGAVFYNISAISARSAFKQLERTLEQRIAWYLMDFVCDFLFICDMIIRFHTGFLRDGLMVVNKQEIHMHYIRKRGFWIDVVSMIPIDIVLISIGQPNAISRINRILRVNRIYQFFDKTETRTNYPNVFRILNLMLYIIICIHLFACAYFSISEQFGFGSDDWVYKHDKGNVSDVSTQYLFSLYWATLTLTTIGEIKNPQRNEEYIFVTISFLCGVLIFATIVGSVGNMITNMNVARTEFLKRMDLVKKYFEVRKVDPVIQKRVFRWFAYIWENKLSFDEDSALAVIPSKLRAEVLMNVHLHTLKRVSIFKNCESSLLAELVLKLKLMVYSPLDYICHKGDVGREMYIIRSGKVQVVSDDGNTIYANLTDGHVFGEVSLLNIAGSKYGNRRTANVRSVGYSDIFILSKEDLWDTLKDYPDAKERLMERGRHILVQQNLLQDDYLLPNPYKRDDVGEEIWQILVELSQMHDRVKNYVQDMLKTKSQEEQLRQEEKDVAELQEEETVFGEQINPTVNLKMKLTRHPTVECSLNNVVCESNSSSTLTKTILNQNGSIALHQRSHEMMTDQNV